MVYVPAKSLLKGCWSSHTTWRTYFTFLNAAYWGISEVLRYHFLSWSLIQLPLNIVSAPSVLVFRCELCVSVLCGGCQRCPESIRAAGDHYGGSAEAESCSHPRSPPHSCLPPARAALPASLPTGETHKAESLSAKISTYCCPVYNFKVCFRKLVWPDLGCASKH